ncbi:MAG: hypothetical protein WD627_10785 [Actinomycetota bacterium]
MAIDFRIHDVPPPTLAAFLEAVAVHPNQDLGRLAEYANFSVSTARKALPTLESLSVVEQSSDNRYLTKAEGVKRADLDSALLVLRRALQAYRPFEALCEGLSLGESLEDAVRKAGLLLGLDSHGTKQFAALVKLGRSLGVLQGEGQTIALAPQFAPNNSQILEVLTVKDVESEGRARLFNARWLGRPANNILDEVDRQLLCDALLKHSVDPKKAVDSAGQALEDFLRELAGSKGYVAESARLNGASQLASLLISKGVIHTHHQKLVEAVSTVRNSSAHRKDKRTLEPWEITEHGALTVMFQTLIAIRSIGEFVIGGRQTI